jgi:predicted DNA-binding transcriptional regulator YafY
MSLLHHLGSAVTEAAAETASVPDAKGWVTVTIPVESTDQAAAELFRLGTEAEVLEPAALRRAIVAKAWALSKLYDRGNAAKRGRATSA